MTTFTIDLSSPERAWQPFLDWLNDQGIEPKKTRAITINPMSFMADVTVMKVRYGTRTEYDIGDDGEVATEVRRLKISSLPPRRAAADTSE